MDVSEVAIPWRHRVNTCCGLYQLFMLKYTVQVLPHGRVRVCSSPSLRCPGSSARVKAITNGYSTLAFDCEADVTCLGQVWVCNPPSKSSSTSAASHVRTLRTGT